MCAMLTDRASARRSPFSSGCGFRPHSFGGSERRRPLTFIRSRAMMFGMSLLRT